MVSFKSMSLWAFLICVCSLSANAQKLNFESFEFYKEKYPEEQAIFLEYFDDVDIKISGDSLIVTSTVTKKMLHLGEQSSVFAKEVIYSSSFNETIKLEAKTFIPNKKKYDPVKVTEFKDSYDKNSSVFFDDTKSTTFFFPAVTPGAITSLSYTQLMTQPKFLGTHLLQSYLPLEHARYTITADNGVKLKLDILHDNEALINKEEINLGNRTKYTFTLKGAKKLKVDNDAPPLRYTVPHIISIIESYDVNGKTQKVLSSTDDLYAWYSSFIDGLKEGDYENIRSILAEIISEEDSEFEKVRKIFYWVQENIKYIAFEDGMRGLIPHNAAYVCDKRYGDCKDMASILVNMLNAAGVKAYFTWIGTRDIPYNYTEYPSPIVDNHMIATYIKDGKYYFLDATSQYSSVELPSSMTQGKEALIGLSKDDYEIVKVPIIDANVNLRSDSSSFRLDNGNVIGSGKMNIYGYPKVFNSFNLIKSSKIGVDKYLTKQLQRGSNKFFVEDYDISNLESKDNPIDIAFEFRVEDYYRQIGNKIYFNMNLDKEFSDDLIEDERTMPLERKFKLKRTLISTLNIPEGYIVARTPKNVSYSSDLIDFELNYTVNDEIVSLEKNITIKTIMIYPDDFETWNEAIIALSKAYRAIVILEKSDS